MQFQDRNRRLLTAYRTVSVSVSTGLALAELMVMYGTVWYDIWYDNVCTIYSYNTMEKRLIQGAV